MQKLTNQQLTDAGLADWRKLAQALHARFLMPDRSLAAEFLTAVMDVANRDGRNLELRLSGDILDVSVCTREDGVWVTQPDADLARKISDLAGQFGLEAAPSMVTQLELALDTAHEARLGPFWSVLLTGSPDNKTYDTIFDPTGRVPNLWFQTTEDHEPPRQRWHFDLWLAPEVAEGRIAAAVAAGGSIVSAAEAPAFTVLADPDGNQVCICTSVGRD